MGTEGAVVKPILFLLSCDAAYITGQTLVVDGGYSIT
jgi:NAD(P)-dependent dehydrogenase (short-subunit alcohol dehydrogenase family)